MFASVGIAYLLWCILGPLGAHRFYVGRPVSGLVWLFTGGLFGIGWIVDFFLIPGFVEEHNKKVFHQQMLETGSSLLFDGEYGHQQGGGGPYYPTPGYEPQQGGMFAGAVAPYSQHVYYPQGGGGGGGRGGGGGYGGGYDAYYS